MICRFPPSCPTRIRRGFSMVELAVSMAVIGLITLAVGSSVTVALRAAQATRDAASPYTQTSTARAAIDLVTDDLKAATTIEPLYVPPWPAGTVGATLTVPARGADSAPETIVYSWAGAGQPLMRQYNNGSAVSIADNVQSFSLTYSPEQMLVQHDGGAGSNIQSTVLSSTAWMGEYFIPTLPASATSWSIKHVKVQFLRNGSATGTVNVQIYAADPSKLPTGSALASASVDMATVSASTPQWVDVSLAGLTGLATSAGYCVVIGTTSGTAGKGVYDNAAATPNGVFSRSTAGATGWSATAGQSLQFKVYGTVTP